MAAEERFPGYYNSDGKPLPGPFNVVPGPDDSVGRPLPGPVELPIQSRNTIYHAGRAAGVREFVQRILHGDDTHRAWLKAAAESYIAGDMIMTEQQVRENRCTDCRWIYGEHSKDCRYYKPKDYRDAATDPA